MAKRKDSASPTPIDATKHTASSRKNIPTEELRDFVREEENRPRVTLYPRDPSLDPQLVWKGKDEQDSRDLEVPAVPIYIQEKVHPQAIIEDFRLHADKVKTNDDQDLGGLFADFNGLPKEFDQRIDFYNHEGHWSNRMILGDSLLVMNSLAEKEGLKGQVQCIYFDPPYGVKFGSNWQVSTRKRDVKDGKAEDASRQPEQVKAFRDTWKLGIHSYLTYLRDRLVMARELLTEAGSVFVQISAENVHLVRCLMDEVLGGENFISLITFATTSGFESNELARGGDYILWYGKNKEYPTKIRPLYQEAIKQAGEGAYRWIMLADGTYRGLTAKEIRGEDPVPANSRLYAPDNLVSQGAASDEQAFTFRGKVYTPGSNSHWKAQFPDGMNRLASSGRLHVAKDSLRYVRFADDFGWRSRNNIWTDTLTGQFTDEKVYVVQTNTKVIERCLMMTTDPGDLVVDPTCGSGTTAVVAEQWGRRWITMDTSRVSLALARTRLMTARFPFYILSDSVEGQKKEAELSGQTRPPFKTDGDVRKGFVYQRVPHVTLKSIANNATAETETLYDKPYEDNKRLRVTGPFTVESLSPHRTISVEQKKAAAEVPNSDGFTVKLMAGGGFVNTILDNLRKAGVQNTFKGERLKFDSLEVFPGQWIAGEGRYTEKDGKERRIAVCIGPEHGTVGSELVSEAAKEAVRGVGFDLLLVCGFAFDPAVSEKAKQFGKLQVLPVKMNPDLAMGDELLKKTGAGNLFMVFGEPDIEIDVKGDKVTVTINGLDVYDPTTGEIRSSSTDDIACWFIDTAYNEESFFVRHAYFTGGGEPYEKLKRALRAEVDESAWSTLYATTSRPFDVPPGKAGKPGKIAVKVINHYGDEVMKVYPVGGKKK